jgi:pyruvate kinase
VTGLLAPAATITYTSSGYTALRAARERPAAPILAITPHLATARRLALAWGVHARPGPEVHDVGEMVAHACRAAQKEGFAGAGETVVIVAGLPFGSAGNTNLLHIARIEG